MASKKIIIGLVDADLLCNGTRHPNLVLMKLAGFLDDNKIDFKLIYEQNEDISQYKYIYISRVFSFTKMPAFYQNATPGQKRKFRNGGTGFYANELNVNKYRQMREVDMTQLENDKFLCKYANHRGGPRKYGIDLARQMPYYKLYDEFIDFKVCQGFDRKKYKDYQKYSIGFLTRGCVRHCPFCVNKLENKVLPYSRLEDFLDNERDERGRLIRPNIYLWDDNFLAADYSIWKPLLQQLIDANRPFQFRQGLDERMLAESPHGEEMAQMLSRAKYHGDFIFAFDNWRDRDLIERALKIWKRYNKHETKFYLFCGFRLKEGDDSKLYRDVWEIFQRIRILMSYGCLGYIMRHEDYHNHELSNIYVQIARWCNQPAFYKKMSFWEFCYRNQTFWEEHTLGRKVKALKTFQEFQEDFNKGYYLTTKMCRPLSTLISFLDRFKDNKEELLEMFNFRLKDLYNPSLWNN